MNAVVLHSVYKRFGRNEVLKGVSMHVPAGAVLAILGRSGSGKTTIARCISMLDTIQAGSIRLGELSILPTHVEFQGTALSRSQLARHRARCGMVFQGFHLFPHMNVLQNLIEAPMGIRKMARAEAERKALAMLDELGLADKSKAFPAALSGGQQQRVAIGRALMMDPDVLLLDEPTSALDPITINGIAAVIRRLADGKRTLVVVTHDMDFARRVSTHVAFMEDGVVQVFSQSSSFFENPESDAARRFMSNAGAMEAAHAGI